LEAYFSPDAVVVDDFTPFVWTAPQAGAAWWRSLDRFDARHHAQHLQAILLRVSDYRTDPEGHNVYMTLHLDIDITIASGTINHASGLWNLTMHRIGNAWKITTATWVNGRP
jgi:hypothetical protein